MREEAELVIIGAGIVGCSAAYYLSQKGWRDVVILEQGPLFEAGGSSSHAPGLVFELNASRTMCQLARWSVELYSQLRLNGHPCFYPVGSLEIAYTPERWEDLKLKLGRAMSWGLPAELICPAEVRRKIPLLDVDRVYGALHVPSDGIAKAVRAAEVMANAARERGAEFHAHTPVTGIEVENGRVQAVITPRGRIRTPRVLLCAGIWGPRVGSMAGVPIPLTPVEHQYARTAPLPELAREAREVVHPVLRHQDRCMYFRQQADCYGIGSYQHEPLLVDPEDIRPHEDALVMPSLRMFTPEHFGKAYESALELFPCFRGVDLPYRINGMFSFTPDGNPLVGESLDVRGFWVAEAVWVTHGGGVGRVVAELMSAETPSVDLRELDLNRFPPHALSRAYIRTRGAQQYREVYDILHPLQQMETPRRLRLSPFHGRLQDLGAVFVETAGWERPQWFNANAGLPADTAWPGRSGWSARSWSPLIGAEHRGTRERVALFDLTAFTKLEVTGPKALDYLQRLTANQMDQPPGRVTYTAMLNDRGGIVCDLTVTRLGPARFLVMSGAASGMHDRAWMCRHLPGDGSAQLTDLTSGLCGIGVWGPKSRALIQSVCGNDFSDAAFPPYTAQRIYVGYIPALALRISYVGELGWEIYAPTEYGLALWDMLWEAGRPWGAIAAGGGAMDSLRLEKGYRLWGMDIHSEYNPYEAGLGFAVRLNKGDFLGRSALLRDDVRGVTRRLCCLTFDDPRVLVMGKEPILDADRVLGYITSANYGYTVRQSIAYGYLPMEYAKEGTKVEVYYFGQRHSAVVRCEPLYDPENATCRDKKRLAQKP
jgi:glycine cleavage system aminomethyltransferase T/glycine/D-amino acid oxidase-like deaminating enzyme